MSTGKATLRLQPDPDPPAALAGYWIGADGEVFAPESTDLTLPDTDAQGRSTLSILLKSAPDSTKDGKRTVGGRAPKNRYA